MIRTMNQTVVAACAASLLLLAGAVTAEQQQRSAPPFDSAPTQIDSHSSKWEQLARSFGGPNCTAKIDPCRDVVMRFVFATEVAEVGIKGGDRVTKGQLLARARDADIVAAIEQQKLLGASDLEIQGSKANADLAAFRFEQLKIGKVFTPEDFERAKADATTTRVQYEQAVLNFKTQKTRLDQLLGQYERYRLEAPFDGIVENVMIEVGKGVSENVDALRIVNTDQLWLDAYPDTEQTLRLGLKTGSPAWVLINLPESPVLIEGKVLYVSPAADYVGQTRRVRVEISNTSGLPAGLQGAVRFTSPNDDWLRYRDPAANTTSPGTMTSDASNKVQAPASLETAAAPQFAAPEPNTIAEAAK